MQSLVNLTPSYCDQEFMFSNKTLHELRSQKYHAEGIKAAGQVGVAIGILREELIKAKKQMPGEESHKSVFRSELDTVTSLLRKFEHENEFVWLEKIPSGDELPVPQGNRIVNVIPYQPKRWERVLAFKI